METETLCEVAVYLWSPPVTQGESLLPCGEVNGLNRACLPYMTHIHTNSHTV